MTSTQRLSTVDIAAGCLLVAAADLADPNFAGTVVFLIEADDDGAFGVVINQPSPMLVADLTAQWGDLCTEPEVAFRGGTVAPNGALALARLRTDADAEGVRRVSPFVGAVDLEGDADRVAAVIDGMRLFAGYAGWGSGQLQGEVDRGDWYVLPSRPDDLFRIDVTTLRRDVLRRQPGDLAFHATRPADPDQN